MGQHLTVISSVGIFEGCTLRHRVHGAEAVDFVVDDGGASFEFTIDLPALRDLARLSSQALAELEALAAQRD